MSKLWKVYCVEEETWVDTWDDNEPTVCPTNGGHNIRSIRLVYEPDYFPNIPIQINNNGDITNVTNVAIGGEPESGYHDTVRGQSTSNGLYVTTGGDVGTTAMHVLKSDGLTTLFLIDAYNMRIGINKSNPTEALDVVGNSLISQSLTVGNNLISTGGYLQLSAISEPSTPPSGISRIYTKTGSSGLFWKSDTGQEISLNTKSPVIITIPDDHNFNKNTTPLGVCVFSLPGTNISTPKSFKVITSNERDTTNAMCSLWCLTTNALIAQSAQYSNEELDIVDLGTISNLPTTESIFQLYIWRVSGSNKYTYAHSIRIDY